MANNLSVKKSKLDLSVYFSLIPSDITACISNKEQMYFFSCRIPKVDSAYWCHLNLEMRSRIFCCDGTQLFPS